MAQFLEIGGCFEVTEPIRGANFYPFPPPVAERLARLWPGGAVCSFIHARRTAVSEPFMNVLDRHFVETNFWRGERPPSKESS
jgi:hypothetical protein